MSIYSDPAYRRARRILLDKTARCNLPCAICGDPIDTTLKNPHPMSFSADHTTELAAGGDLLGDLQPTHLGCNSSRGAIFRAKRRRHRLDSNRYTGERLPWLR